MSVKSGFLSGSTFWGPTRGTFDESPRARIVNLDAFLVWLSLLCCNDDILEQRSQCVSLTTLLTSQFHSLLPIVQDFHSTRKNPQVFLGVIYLLLGFVHRKVNMIVS